MDQKGHLTKEGLEEIKKKSKVKWIQEEILTHLLANKQNHSRITSSLLILFMKHKIIIVLRLELVLH